MHGLPIFHVLTSIYQRPGICYQFLKMLQLWLNISHYMVEE